MMNCQNAEQLIPLFVEADLDTAEMQQVTQHVATCNSCHEIVAEFQVSQSSLHALALPEFDEAGLRAMRTAVQDEIARPTIADWIALRWNWKLVWAAAAACLVLGAFVFSRQSPPVHETKQVAVREDHQDSGPSSTNASRASGTLLRAVARQRPAPLYPTTRATALGTVPAPPTAESVTTSPSPALAVTASSEAATPAPEPEMLRMEIHTADPNIKIIWLTPKEPTRAIPAPLTEATK